jgi:hypothetical protein
MGAAGFIEFNLLEPLVRLNEQVNGFNDFSTGMI